MKYLVKRDECYFSKLTTNKNMVYDILFSRFIASEN